MNFKLTTGPTEELAGKLSSKDIDLAFVRKLMNPAFQSYPFFEDPIRLYVYKDHPLGAAGRASIRDIRRETLVFFECGSLDWRGFTGYSKVWNSRRTSCFRWIIPRRRRSSCWGGRGSAFTGAVRSAGGDRGKFDSVDIAETAGISLQTHLISLNGQNNEFLDSLLELGGELSY